MSISPFSPGCDLWIAADAARSSWARKLDWHLNFQAMRAEDHHSVETSSELRKIQESWQLENPEIELNAKAPLMIASRANLPNSKTVFVPYSGNLATWARECQKVYRSLYPAHQPKVRIFLPDLVKQEDFLAEWRKTDPAAASYLEICVHS